MRTIDIHHDGHGLNESIILNADAPDASGASHKYTAYITQPNADGYQVASVQFQKGPRNVESSIAGMTEAALLAILIDRLRGFQAGPYS